MCIHCVGCSLYWLHKLLFTLTFSIPTYLLSLNGIQFLLHLSTLKVTFIISLCFFIKSWSNLDICFLYNSSCGFQVPLFFSSWKKIWMCEPATVEILGPVVRHRYKHLLQWRKKTDFSPFLRIFADRHMVKRNACSTPPACLTWHKMLTWSLAE